MSTTICFDFGNTRLKAAIFNGNQLEKIEVLENDAVDAVKKLLDQYQPSKTLLSSVIHHDQVIESLLTEYGPFHLLGPATKLNFTTPVGKPETIGADR
ncbi:MAG: hypothetical protein RLZZ462_1009, partial [Bacteroidota bacterium]